MGNIIFRCKCGELVEADLIGEGRFYCKKCNIIIERRYIGNGEYEFYIVK